jgi:NAD+ diphosphatase
MLPDFEMGMRDVSAAERAWYFVFRGNDLLCAADRSLPEPMTREVWQESPFGNLPAFYFGSYRGLPCYAVHHEADAAVPAGMEWTGLRRLLVDESATLYSLAGRGRQILEFNLTHRYCGKCGQPTVAHARDLARECQGCGHVVYPRVSPCMIVLVTRGEELLLARSARFPNAMYSTLAGFVEPGETIEQAVHREVLEEVGVRIAPPVYFGSQPWPFPHQLMIGFHAEYAGGEIRIGEEEIVDARWWHYRELPLTPPGSAMSGMLIQDYVRRCGEGGGQGNPE